MTTDHRFAASLVWTGNRGSGTSGPRDFGRDHVISLDGKPDIHGSAARAFRGDLDRWNPEELLIAALAQCHMLSYFYVALAHGIVVEAYSDTPEGILVTTPDGAGRFREVTLRPVVTISSGDPAEAETLHDEAHRLCFIAASVAFPVHREPTVIVATG